MSKEACHTWIQETDTAPGLVWGAPPLQQHKVQSRNGSSVAPRAMPAAAVVAPRSHMYKTGKEAVERWSVEDSVRREAPSSSSASGAPEAVVLISDDDVSEADADNGRRAAPSRGDKRARAGSSSKEAPGGSLLRRRAEGCRTTGRTADSPSPSPVRYSGGSSVEILSQAAPRAKKLGSAPRRGGSGSVQRQTSMEDFLRQKPSER